MCTPSTPYPGVRFALESITITFLTFRYATLSTPYLDTQFFNLCVLDALQNILFIYYRQKIRMKKNSLSITLCT